MAGQRTCVRENEEHSRTGIAVSLRGLGTDKMKETLERDRAEKKFVRIFIYSWNFFFSLRILFGSVWHNGGGLLRIFTQTHSIELQMHPHHHTYEYFNSMCLCMRVCVHVDGSVCMSRRQLQQFEFEK